MKPKDLFVTIKQFTLLYPWPTEHGLRNLRKHAQTNGFDTAFVNVGKRILIDVNEFWNCVSNKEKKDERKKC